MPNLKTQSIVDYFNSMNKHVFSINEVAKLTKKKKSYLSRLLPTNPKIKRLERGKYYIDGADTYEIASNILEPSYISLMSAFRYYDLTTQMLTKISVITTLRHKKVIFGGMLINFTTLNAKRVFGYKKIRNIRMATVEKAIIDSMYIGEPPYSYIEEAFEKAKSGRIIDEEKIKEYAIEMASSSLISRLGFMLESFGIGADDLLKYKSKRNIILFGKGIHKDRRWGVLYD